MKKKYVIFAAAASLIISIFALASEPAKNNSWRKIVWVDERGVEHTTLTSNRGSTPPAAQQTQSPAPVAPQAAPQTNPPIASGHSAAPSEIITAKVVRVKGVDVVELANGKTARYIGLRGPAPNQPSYKTALAAHRKMVEGKYVNILTGPQPLAPDGSVWAFVFINRLTFVNADLIRFGYAYAHPVEPNTEYQILFSFLQQRASSRKLGVWNDKSNPQ